MTEKEFQNAVSEWKTHNGRCIYTPVYTCVGDDEKDYIMFFEESGASIGYFGAKEDKPEGDNIPIFLYPQLSIETWGLRSP